MSGYIPMIDGVTPGWLTQVLKQARFLDNGEVIDVEEEATGAFNSQTSHLRLTYSEDVPAGTPTRLVLKRNAASEWGREAGAEEVKFYTLISSLPDHPPITIPCYAAAYDDVSKNSYLLLLDLSETHQPPLTRDQQINIVEGVPREADIETVITTLAQFHAYWWEHPLIEQGIFDVGYGSFTVESFEEYRQRRLLSWQDLLAKEQDWFPADLLELYALTLTGLPYHWERYLEPRFRLRKNLTLTHGDTYFANFLCPKVSGSAATYLLDWQSSTFDVGGYDLVNVHAPFWTPEQRHEQQREDRIMRHYHEVLLASGVKNYSWDELVIDYQMGLIFWFLVPLQDRFDGSARSYWWPKMQCLAVAFRDWHCEDLLKPTL